MATDATGTPTSPDSLPTYNTAGDPPSGKGFNAAMAAIQTALTARIKAALMTTVGDMIYASGAGVAARLGIGSTGQVLTVAGGVPTWANAASAGAEVAYAESAVDVAVTGTAFATPTTIITAPAFTADGTSAYLFEYWCPSVNTPGGVRHSIMLWEDGVQKKYMAEVFPDFGGGGVRESMAKLVRYRFVPTAGAHTYSVRGVVSSSTATHRAALDSGGTALSPLSLRITKVT